MFWLLTLGVAVIAGGTAALRWLRIARLIEDTPQSRIRSAAQGYVELSGNGLPLPGTRNLAPLTQRPCVWWRYRVSRRTERGSGKNRREAWETVASGTSSIAFLLDDDTGQCVVQPDGAEVVAGRIDHLVRRHALAEVGHAGPHDLHGRPRVSATSRNASTSTSACMRWATSARPPRPPRRVTPTEAAELLVEWKRDQPALLQRFDADRDGRIGLDEWEAARTAAKAAVLERSRERGARENWHVLCRPDDGRLFLLAALPPGDLARRYRRRALLAFAAFVGAVYALGWLLQGAFG